jgi:membrane complex biogenesis BtpA family protein
LPSTPFTSVIQKPVIGMLHLPALPGSSRHALSMPQIIAHALRDAEALATGGVHALIAALTAAAVEVRKRFDLPLGINCLRNDGRGALAIAVAAGAQFIRVNVLCSARVTDQGVIQGIAHDLLRDRARLKADDVKIMADVDVKHSAPLAPISLEAEVEDTLRRGLADALIVSGQGTGKPTDADHVRRVKAVAGDAPVFIGSGVTAETIASYLPHADGFIVGTAFKRDGKAENPVEIERVRDLVAALGAPGTKL